MKTASLLPISLLALFLGGCRAEPALRMPAAGLSASKPPEAPRFIAEASMPSAPVPAADLQPEVPKSLELFLLVGSPFCEKAVTELKGVLHDLEAESIDLSVSYIGHFGALGAVDLESEARLQLCAIDQYPQKLKFLDYLACRFKTRADDRVRSKATDPKACAGGRTGFDAQRILACAEGEEGKRLVDASFAKSRAAGVKGAPTWFINRKYEHGGWKPAAFKQALCAYNDFAGCRLSVPVLY